MAFCRDVGSRISACFHKHTQCLVWTGPLSEEEILQRCEWSATQTHTLGETGWRLQHAYRSQRGYYPDDLEKANQDAFHVAAGFAGKADQFLMGVFDGHGEEGDLCSLFVRNRLEALLIEAMEEHTTSLDAFRQVFYTINRDLRSSSIHDNHSGTTAIVALFLGSVLHVANVGDSRCIIGSVEGDRTVASALSSDHTPFRADELRRVKAAGALVMTTAMIEGKQPVDEDWSKLNTDDDPPRIWSVDLVGPGCAFTRSIGDAMAEPLGVISTPEVVVRNLTAADKFVMVASDGVFEFLDNQKVADIVMPTTDAEQACRAVVAEAYRLWLQNDVRTDDITCVLVFLHFDDGSGGGATRRKPSLPSAPGGLVKAELERWTSVSDRWDEEDVDGAIPPTVLKTPPQLAMIKEAIGQCFLCLNLPETVQDAVLAAFVRQQLEPGEALLLEGENAKAFFVLESGELLSTRRGDGVGKQLLRQPGAPPPSFGTLGLLYDKPHAATLTARSPAVLWRIERRSFRSLVARHYAMAKAGRVALLRRVEALKSLSLQELAAVAQRMHEGVFEDRAVILQQDSVFDGLFIVLEGHVEWQYLRSFTYGEATPPAVLGPGGCIGEASLLLPPQTSRTPLIQSAGRSLMAFISRADFEAIAGPLERLRQQDAERVHGARAAWARRNEVEGLHETSLASWTELKVVRSFEIGQYLLARHANGRVYTLKAISKRAVTERGLQRAVVREKRALEMLTAASRCVPLLINTFTSSGYLFQVFKAAIVTDLRALMVMPLSETTTRFVAASVALGLSHLHQEGFVYRTLSPEAIMIDLRGVPQLTDFRCIMRNNGLPRFDICGMEPYLAPEQVMGRGHTFEVDWWALGVVIYEMTTGVTPWAMRETDSEPEVSLYTRIVAHDKGLPPNSAISMALHDVLLGLLQPNPEFRLACSEKGVHDLLRCAWFGENLDISSVANESAVSPLWERCTAIASRLPDACQVGEGACLPDEQAYVGDTEWLLGFVEFQGDATYHKRHCRQARPKEIGGSDEQFALASPSPPSSLMLPTQHSNSNSNSQVSLLSSSMSPSTPATPPSAQSAGTDRGVGRRFSFARLKGSSPSTRQRSRRGSNDSKAQPKSVSL